MCVCVCVCVCVSNANPLNFTCFGFRAMRIDGVSVVYFIFSHLLGRSHYVGDVYLYLCTEISEVRVTVCVTVCVALFCCVG